MLGRFATVFTRIEMGATWAAHFLYGLKRAIPRPDGGDRIFGLLAALYRLWANAGVQDSMPWQEQWVGS